MDVHLENCRFGTLICPQKCGLQVRRKSIETHIRNSCPKRRVLCDHCTVAIPLDESQFHVDNCSKAPSQCNHCSESMLREQLQYHLKTSCPQVVVDCRYKKVGCMERMERQLMAEHIQKDMQLHMDLLASKFDQLQIPAATPAYSQYNPVTDASLVDYTMDYPAMGATANASAYPKEMPYTRGTSALDTIALEKYEARASDQSMLDKSHSKYPVGMGNVTSMGGRSLQRHPSNVSDSGDPRLSVSDSTLDLEVGQLKERVQNLQRNIVQQNQEIIMLKANAERAQIDAKKATDSLYSLESRLCNGEFYWRLQGYAEMVREAQRGETSVRHSKGFYTGFYGYKLCLRVNVNVSESSHNSHVSLFVHFLKGEFDDLVDWPFSGKITLTIMDQNADSSKRKHISETLLSKPDLAAFHRPRTHRNHKGFGYMEFAPVNMLDAGTFIKDDILLIKVLVEMKKL
ncbi:TNF receptor-associated factor 6-like isoform X2 [Amphiura filiformis]